MSAPNVLLVDDEESIVRSLSRELSELGWHVQTASDAESAVRALQQRAFDALVLDLQLPGPNGVHVLGELDRLLNRPVSVLISGYLSVDTTVRAIRSGANDVLEKPLSGKQLDGRLRALLRDRQAAPDEISAAFPGKGALHKILGETAGIRAVREQMRTAARYPELFVTIVGESGTGKELVAEAIHSLAGAGGRYLPVSLAAIPEHLMEVELFGCEADAGQSARAGLFELVGTGTLFFNEIADLPPALHAKLRRLIETRVFSRVGSDAERPLQARLLAATRRRPSSQEPHAELFDRLSHLTILLPSLRDRGADIKLIAEHILADFAASARRPVLMLSAPALGALLEHHWPGNVRELEIVVSEAVEAARGPSLSAEEIRAAICKHGMPARSSFTNETASGTFPTVPPTSEPLRTLERRLITDAWQSSGQNLSAAARSLGLPRTTLRDRLKKYGLR